MTEVLHSTFTLERTYPAAQAWYGIPAAKVNRVEDLPYRVGQLLGSKKLVQMTKAAKALGRPNAARDICEEVIKRVGAH